MYKIGEIFKETRLEKNMSLEEVAKNANISKSTLSNIENNKIRNPKSVFIYRICKVLNLDYNSIIRLRWELFPTFLYERN